MTTATRVSTATPAPPVAALSAQLSVSTDHFVLVPSDTQPGVEYKTSANGCTCPDFRFKSAKIRGYACKHMIRKFPPIKMCEQCHINPVDGFIFCSDACARAARKLDMAIRADVAVVVEQPKPTCPGYLKQHAAPADEAITYWCSCCDQEGTVAA